MKYKDFDPKQFKERPKDLEIIKLEDGIHHHEYVRVELERYAYENKVERIKPFMLVVAQDTIHSGELKAIIESDTFFDGRYRGKVIEVHSNQGAEESDEAMQRLLAVENDNDTEIVIHVNKLKEGWDVKNLYTIVPLRASAAEILTEQTIDRGLRLPYGQRTGDDAVDRLTIISHDRFQEIIDRANNPNSIIYKAITIGENGDIPANRNRLLEVPSHVQTQLTGQAAQMDGQVVARLKLLYQDDEDEIRKALIAYQKQLGGFIWVQMEAHLVLPPTNYMGKVTQGFSLLQPLLLELREGDDPRNFRHPVEEKSRIRQMVFAGFTKCCYPYQKFDSVEGELRLAMVLEDDDDVLKWLKPAPGQFRIEYSRGRNYQPDFVVETKDRKFIIEPKRADQIGLEEVQEKAAAARQWVGFANEHVVNYGGKPWKYLLIPHNGIRLGATMKGLVGSYRMN